MSERRFTEKPDLDPEAVRSLAPGHPALVGNRTLFPSTVVTVTDKTPDRLLVSGVNNIKIGKTVEKGEFKGYGIFMLSLEERATCPDDCEVRGFCYGNGMQMARRHRIGDPDVFFDRLGAEIVSLLDEHPGILIRLHVLGDFPSVEYVSFWKEVLDEYPNVACFGYTHRAPKNWDGDEIGDAIQAVKDVHPTRFRIRWSGTVARADGATVLNLIPRQPRGPDGEIVCPSQTDDTACCATCALCWDKAAMKEAIGFIKHGPKSNEVAAQAEMRKAFIYADEGADDGAVVSRLPPPPAADDFDKLLVAAMPSVRRYALKLCRNASQADDLTQEAIAKALKNRAQFQPGTNLAAWVSTIMRNGFLDGTRKSGREVGDPEGFLIGNAHSNDDTEAAFEAREALASLETLTPLEQQTLRMAGDGKTMDEMAEEQGVPVGTIKSRLSRARDSFEEAIENGDRLLLRAPDAALAQILSKSAPPEIDLKVNETNAPVPEVGHPQRRRIRGIQLPQSIRDGYAKTFMSPPPESRLVVPSTLIVEVGYQRDLSGKSLRLIKNIVANWDWAKFKPPVCAETPDGLFVIDGQHTAIAAASHPKIEQIPVMVVSRPDIEDRAAAFVSQNMNRVAMSPLQIFHAQLVAGDKDALGILRCVVKAGASVPRSPPQKGKEKPGELVTVTPLYRMWKARGAAHVERVLRIAVLSGKAPITSTILYGLDIALTMEPVNDDMELAVLGDEEIAFTVERIDVEKEAAAEAAANDISRYHALAGIIEHNVWHVNSEAFGALAQAAE